MATGLATISLAEVTDTAKTRAVGMATEAGQDRDPPDPTLGTRIIVNVARCEDLIATNAGTIRAATRNPTPSPPIHRSYCLKTSTATLFNMSRRRSQTWGLRPTSCLSM